VTSWAESWEVLLILCVVGSRPWKWPWDTEKKIALLQPSVRTSLVEQTCDKAKRSAVTPSDAPVSARGDGAGFTAAAAAGACARASLHVHVRVQKCVRRTGRNKGRRNFNDANEKKHSRKWI